MPRPAFISLDGVRGAGVSTQCRLLADWLAAQPVPVTSCSDPGGTPVGDQFLDLVAFGREHAIAPATELFLRLAARAQLVAVVIRPALDRGGVVVADRFTLVDVVHCGHAGGLDPADVWRVGRLATGGLDPDLTVVLDAPVGVAAARAGAADEDAMRRVKTGYLFEAGRQPDRYRLVDASADAEAVHLAVRREVARLLAGHGWSLGGG